VEAVVAAEVLWEAKQVVQVIHHQPAQAKVTTAEHRKPFMVVAAEVEQAP
jgi:hypothetical protein